MTLIEIVTILGGLGSAAGTLYGFYRFIVRPVYLLIKRLKKSFEILEQLQSEFKPNGGTSLRDAINRIETRLLIEQHARRALSMALDAGVFETDSQGLCIWVNQCYSDLSGLSVEEAKNYGWVTGIYESDRERVVTEWDSAVRQKRMFSLEYSMLNSKQHELSKVKCTAFPVFNAKNELIHYTGIVIKIEQELIRPKYIAGS